MMMMMMMHVLHVRYARGSRDGGNMASPKRHNKSFAKSISSGYETVPVTLCLLSIDHSNLLSSESCEPNDRKKYQKKQEPGTMPMFPTRSFMIPFLSIGTYSVTRVARCPLWRPCQFITIHIASCHDRPNFTSWQVHNAHASFGKYLGTYEITESMAWLSDISKHLVLWCWQSYICYRYCTDQQSRSHCCGKSYILRETGNYSQ